jgi:hypothetical protein
LDTGGAASEGADAGDTAAEVEIWGAGEMTPGRSADETAYRQSRERASGHCSGMWKRRAELS